MEKVSKGVEYILRCAIAKGGSVGYNPYMYRLGCADNIPPSDNFNSELQKYGRIDWGRSSFLGEGNDGWDVPGVWHAFYINDKGRSAIKTIDLERNGKFGYKKILRCLWYAFIILLKGVVLCLGLGILLSYFLCNIEEGDKVGCLFGFWHGLFAIPNFFRYVIDDNVLFYSSNHTVGYIICYILVLIPESIAFVGVIKGAINNIIKKCLNPFK